MEPRVRIAVDECHVTTTPRRWSATWLVSNDGPAPLELNAAWIPHGRFRGLDRVALSCELAAGASTRLTMSVETAEAPGTIVENAFLILRVTLQGHPWRIFTRMRIEFSSSGEPMPIVEVVTTQSIE
jgi:hypothetical protein